MPRANNEKQKPVVALPQDDEEEADILKPKEGPIDIPEADEKAIDPDLLEAEDEVAAEDEDEDEAAVLDVEEVDPFGDKWEQ